MDRIELRMKKDKTDEIYVVEKVPGLLFETTNKQLFKFENEAETKKF